MTAELEREGWEWGWRGRSVAGQSLLSPPGLCLNVLPASPLPRPACTDAGVRATMSHRLSSALSLPPTLVCFSISAMMMGWM